MLKADSLFDDMICSYAIDENRASLVRLKTLLNEMDSTIDKTLKEHDCILLGQLTTETSPNQPWQYRKRFFSRNQMPACN